MKNNLLTIISVLFLMSFGHSQSIETFFKDADSFFRTYVSEGKVSYDAIHEDQKSLNELVSAIEATSIINSDANTQQAFYINAYNILVIQGIITNYPLNSPLDKSGFFDKISYKVSGEEQTLNDIENKKLRAQFDDARFHFVLVCGAIGCPPLINQAYLPNTLNAQLQKQSELALNNPDFIKVKKNKVQLSEIFKWYKEDFVKSGDEIDFINSFRTNKIDKGSKLSFYPYNWNLNQQ